MCKYLLEYCYLVYSVQVPAEVRCFHNLLLCVVCRYWSEYAVLLLVALCVAKRADVCGVHVLCGVRCFHGLLLCVLYVWCAGTGLSTLCFTICCFLHDM